MQSGKIEWTNASRKLGELVPWPRNPRQIKQDQAKRLAQSFEEFGQVETIAIGPDGEVYNGHQRLNVLMDKHGADYAVEVRIASRALTEKEREKLTVFLHKGAAGEWDFDTLSEWDVEDLLDWGFKSFELGIPGADDPNAEWKDMPEFEQEDKQGIIIRVHFENKEYREEFFTKLGVSHTDQTNSFWYPERPEGLRNQLGTGMTYTHES